MEKTWTLNPGNFDDTSPLQAHAHPSRSAFKTNWEIISIPSQGVVLNLRLDEIDGVVQLVGGLDGREAHADHLGHRHPHFFTGRHKRAQRRREL